MKRLASTALLVIIAAACVPWPAQAQPPAPPAAPPAFETGALEPAPPGVRAPACDPGPRELRHGKKVVRLQGGPPFLPILGILLPFVFLLGVVVVVVAALYVAHRAARMRFETLNLAIKEGKELPPELFRNGFHRRSDPLFSGLALVAVGLGLGIALGVAVAPTQAVWGLIPFLLGVALLVYVPLSRRQKQD